MDFGLSEEQRLLKDSVETLLTDHYGFDARKGYLAESGGFSASMWRRYAELGLTGLPFAERHGGSGGGPVETMIVMEAFGRALALEPYLATVVLAGGLIQSAGSDAQQATLLSRIADGALRLAFAHGERQARYDLADIAARARRDGDGYLIDGEKSLVIHGDSADMLIVSARIGGERRDRNGIGLFVVDAQAPGVSRRGYDLTGGQRGAEVTLSGARAEALGEPGDALPAIERVIDAAIAALCAEAVGALAAMHEITVDYLKTRKQFGVPIGSFQVLQHRAVDMLTALEQARSMAMFATMMTEESDARERAKAMSAAKVQVGRSVQAIGQAAIQLHGGIGMTMEYRIGHYFKRVTAIDALFGNAEHHLARVAAFGGVI